MSPAYHEFDFWLGDWDAFDVDNPNVVVARNHVDSILGGCVLLEDYRGSDGSGGRSFSLYDKSRNVWHQTWVTTRGKLLVIEGNLESGEMVLSGPDSTAYGRQRLIRGVWKPYTDRVRETAVTSVDQGRTWQPLFDIIFRQHSSPVPDDAKAVADLDAEYQAAVKVNDPTTMARILSDDYALVTGSGKIYNKADLLHDARSGRTIFERNDELEKNVRVWGDTAVVTARLWEKGTESGRHFDRKFWFSDTYVRTRHGWEYVFGQSSLPPSH
jgi:Domain of unknown function (DUF4440)